MSIGDGFNIWMGKFLWDCVEVGAVILGVFVFYAAKLYAECRRERKEKHSQEVGNGTQ